MKLFGSEFKPSGTTALFLTALLASAIACIYYIAQGVAVPDLAIVAVGISALLFVCGICIDRDNAVKNAEAEKSKAVDEAQRQAEEEAAAEAKAKQEAEHRVWSETHGLLQFKVAGVTFKNDDRTSRQSILRSAKQAADLADNVGDGFSELVVTIEEARYKDERSYKVLIDGRQVGNVPREYVENVHDIYDQILDISIDIDSFINEDDERIYWGMVSILYQK